MLWRSSMLVTLLVSAVTKNAPANPLECTLTKLLDLKSFGICSYKKGGGGAVPKMRLASYLNASDVVELGIDGLGESRQKLLAYEAAEAVYAHSLIESVGGLLS